MFSSALLTSLLTQLGFGGTAAGNSISETSPPGLMPNRRAVLYVRSYYNGRAKKPLALWATVINERQPPMAHAVLSSSARGDRPLPQFRCRRCACKNVRI
jgi:hypothetical protein